MEKFTFLGKRYDSRKLIQEDKKQREIILQSFP